MGLDPSGNPTPYNTCTDINPSQNKLIQTIVAEVAEDPVFQTQITSNIFPKPFSQVLVRRFSQPAAFPWRLFFVLFPSLSCIWLHPFSFLSSGPCIHSHIFASTGLKGVNLQVTSTSEYSCEPLLRKHFPYQEKNLFPACRSFSVLR